MKLHPDAIIAIRAAKGYKRWGRYAATRYAQKHGVLRLYYLARILEATA